MVLNIETSHNLTSISLSSKEKIESILNFKFSKPMPDAIEDLIKKKK